MFNYEYDIPFYASVDCGGNIYSNIPSHLILDAGEYTIVYSPSGNYSSGTVEEYISSLTFSINNTYSSFQIDLSLTMYDGNCYREGCMDPIAFNYDDIATSNDDCNYALSFGELQCGQPL